MGHWLGRMGVLVLMGLCLVSQAAQSCTAFQFETPGRVFVGKNYDYPDGGGFVFVNPVGVSKTAMVFPPDMPLVWQSKYGSVSFNQFGRENPAGGMNEMGLVIEVLWLDETAFPKPDRRFAVGELNWVQYHLDCSETVEQVIGSEAFLRIHQNAFGRIHYLVADRAGDTAVVEFLDGKQVVHRGGKLPYRVVENLTYENSLNYVKNRPLGKRCYEKPLGQFSDRFEYVFRMLEDCPVTDPNLVGQAVDYGFATLDKAAFSATDLTFRTQWSIVYDVTGGAIYFKTAEAPVIKRIDLNNRSYECRRPLRMAALDVERDPREFWQSYDRQQLLDQIRGTINSIPQFKAMIPEGMVEMLVAAPETFPCVKPD